MTDLVERLRERADVLVLMREAADEIERLRREVAKHEAQIKRLIRIGSEHPITFVPQEGTIP